MPTYIDAKEFDRIHATGKRLKEIFKRDKMKGVDGMEDYLVRAVEEAKDDTCLSDFGAHDWQPFGIPGWLCCSKCKRKMPMK